MNFYFFLDSEVFNSETTMCSFPPSGHINFNNFSPLYLYFAYPENNYWTTKLFSEVHSYTSFRLKPSDLGITKKKASQTLLFFSPKKINSKLKELPNFSNFNDTQPMWRANIAIKGKDTSSSFQGEFPYELSSIPNGSIVGMVPFIQKNLKNYLYFVSFSTIPINKIGKVHIIDVFLEKIIFTSKIISNSVNFIKLDNLENHNNQLMIVSDGLMGAPVFISANKDKSRLSLEHTHPPTEYIIHGHQNERREIIKNMKYYWSNIDK